MELAFHFEEVSMKPLKMYVRSGTGMHFGWGRGFKTSTGLPQASFTLKT